MNMNEKQLSNPFSTGGGGAHFEAHVQASFVALMLTGGYAPCLPCWPIVQIKLQGKIEGFNTDDLIVFVEEPSSKEKRRLLCQIKHSIAITHGDKVFSEVIQAAWNDFNNPRVFSKGKDILALITGPLNATDFHNVQWLLSQARHTKDLDEFYRNVEQANFSPPKSTEKLEVIRHHLRLANNNAEITKDNLYLFLKHFHLLGYDLGKEIGVVLSLLHSHISQFNRQHPEWIWSRIVDIVQTWNQDAGTITPTILPDDLKEIFKQPVISYIPSELTIQPEPAKTDWNRHQHAPLLALINLIGAWNENNEADIDIFKRIIKEDYSTWVLKVREILQHTDSPLLLKNGLWKITERNDLWNILGLRIFDQDLDALKEAVVTVLTERDPTFELPSEERYLANIRGKVLSHSRALRKGVAESLALLGNKEEALINCSRNKGETTAILAIRKIFEGADWILWGSLNSLLPILAEAAPEEFLSAVENALSIEPCPFDKLFSQEGNGLTGSNYLTGLLWALEELAWDEIYLVRVCVVLGELASHDPGGNWTNRSSNSLTTILLPWLPQTVASISKRKVAVQTLCKEWPDIAWKLIINLLPNQHQMSTGSHKPVWRNIIPEDWEKDVTQDEYWQQITFYAEIAVSLASQNTARLNEFIDHFDNLPQPSFDHLLEALSSEAISGLPEEERLPFWDKLTKLISRHRYFSEEDWAFDEDVLSLIEVVADKLAPSNPLNLYQHLFTDQDFEFYEEENNWEEQQKKLDKRRQKAIGEILDLGGINAVIQFAATVQFPGQVGGALGCIVDDEEIDKVLLPAYLELEGNKHSGFIDGYVWSRHYINGWSWVDALDKTGWNIGQMGQFLVCLPFTGEAWARAAQWLGELERDYWHNVKVNPYQAKDDLAFAIDQLIEHGRPHAAIHCLNTMRHLKQSPNVTQSIKALMAALFSSEPSYSMNVYHIVELIKVLQENLEVPEDDLFRVEWAYLPLLDRHHRASPKLLENRLASDPDFFCEVIRLIYRSKKSEATATESSEETKAMATNAWRLLHEWRTPPGMQKDGSFKGEHFSTWLRRVKEICTESGHLEVALVNVGEILIHGPADPDGLWINHVVADALNARDAEDMRRGFRTGIFNSRGVHWVDPTGKPEWELAGQYRQKAEEVENAGYQRLAGTLRNLSESYVCDAERIIAEHKMDEKTGE